MSVKPIIQLYPVIPAQGKEREALRPIGRNRERYHQVIRDWAKLAQAADQLGYWGFSTIEHHFHSEGRFFAGFARGYQARWTNILGQHYNSKATLSDGSADDELNRQVFEEQMDIVLKCWTEDAVSYNGKFFKIPYPYETGVRGYPAYELARKSGTPSEVGPNNEIRTISVVPAPYQKPHPPVFVASSASKDSAIYCGKRGFVPCYFAPIDKAVEHGVAC